MCFERKPIHVFLYFIMWRPCARASCDTPRTFLAMSPSLYRRNDEMKAHQTECAVDLICSQFHLKKNYEIALSSADCDNSRNNSSLDFTFLLSFISKKIKCSTLSEYWVGSLYVGIRWFSLRMGLPTPWFSSKFTVITPYLRWHFWPQYARFRTPTSWKCPTLLRTLLTVLLVNSDMCGT